MNENIHLAPKELLQVERKSVLKGGPASANTDAWQSADQPGTLTGNTKIKQDVTHSLHTSSRLLCFAHLHIKKCCANNEMRYG